MGYRREFVLYSHEIPTQDAGDPVDEAQQDWLTAKFGKKIDRRTSFHEVPQMVYLFGLAQVDQFRKGVGQLGK